MFDIQRSNFIYLLRKKKKTVLRLYELGAYIIHGKKHKHKTNAKLTTVSVIIKFNDLISSTI